MMSFCPYYSLAECVGNSSSGDEGTIARLTAENAALRARLETVEAETRERCAKVAEDEDGHFTWAGMDRNVVLLRTCAAEIAQAIRNLEPRHD